MVTVTIGGKTPAQIFAKPLPTSKELAGIVSTARGRIIRQTLRSRGYDRYPGLPTDQIIKLQKQQEAARRAAAKAALEKARQEAARKEAARRAAAKAVFTKAIASAKARKSKSAQQRARDIFQRAQTSAKEERQKTVGKGRKEFEELIKKETERIPKELFIEERVVSTFRRGGKEIPVIKYVIVDERGMKVRDATQEESARVEKFRSMLRVPERELKVSEKIEKRATELRQKRLIGKEDVKGELELAGLTVAGSVIGLGIAITQLPKLPGSVLSSIKRYIKDPASIREIPESIRRGGAEFGYLMKVSPTEAFVKIGSEILILKGVGKALKVTGRLTSKAAAKLSPKFRGVVKRTISIPSLQKGKTIKIKVSSKIGRGRIPEQLKFGGKRVTAVSAQADRLVRIIKTRKIIRKPIPGEATLTKATKKLLKKFDKRTITSKELIHLDRRIRVEAKKGLLERSFFADPKGVVRKRFLRLGTEKEASLFDYLSGDVTFKTSRPQILVFEDVKVQAFPKTNIFK